MWNIKLMSLYFMSHILEERYFTTKGWKQKGKKKGVGNGQNDEENSLGFSQC